jgi:hypothetical protein
LPLQDPSLAARGFAWVVHQGHASIVPLDVIVSTSGVARCTFPYFLLALSALARGGMIVKKEKGEASVATEEMSPLP